MCVPVICAEYVYHFDSSSRGREKIFRYLCVCLSALAMEEAIGKKSAYYYFSSSTGREILFTIVEALITGWRG